MNKLAALLAILGAAAFVLISSLYTVSEVEQMIITQFGKPVGEPVTTAGLKTKIPFIQQVNSIEKRVLEWDGSICRLVRALADYRSAAVLSENSG
jgi:membrane protease subunit HflC